MDPPAVGLHLGIAEAVYRSWPAVNQSLLGSFSDGRTPAHARYEMMNPKDPTAAMLLGTGIHHAILEPALFEEDYAPWAGEKRSKAGRAKWKAFEIENAGKEILSQDDYDTCLAVRDAVWRNPRIASLLTARQATEACAVWEDPETGILCKSRIDALTTDDGWTVIADIKSTRDASPNAFERSIANYNYHVQAAFYIDGLDALQPRARKFYFLCVEKDPPYCSAVYELEYESLEKGRRDYRAALEQWSEAESTGLWPGYPTEVQTLGLPRWKLSQAEEAIF